MPLISLYAVTRKGTKQWVANAMHFPIEPKSGMAVRDKYGAMWRILSVKKVDGCDNCYSCEVK